MSKPLTAKQSMFVKEYLIDLNATQAAIRAGYSEKTAGKIGQENLIKPDVQAAIQIAMDSRASKLDITAERVLAEIAKMAFVNFQDLYDESGNLIEVQNLPRDVAAAVSTIKINLTEASALQEIKLHDKGQALERLGRHLKLFTDKVEHSGKFTLEQLVSGEID